MQATLTWIDLTAGDRDKMRRVLDLFNEQGTLDEMGLGSLRDALSDALFPGTSYIHTRLRYVLFIPWLYQRLEQRRTRASDVARAARRAEIDLIGPLEENPHPEETAARCARKLVKVVHPTRARVHARFFQARRGVAGGAIEPEEIRVRTVFALRFGHTHTDEDQHISQDAARAAFNSPFRPFVLTSTSIGQEGLDFHPWCHRLIHWNLPGNPVDLEQREGRIHRYKGHAVRRNVAEAHARDALARWRSGKDIWSLIFDQADKAARAANDDYLVPHWIAPGKHRVQRHVPQLPYTAELEAFKRLKRQLAAYRVVFGQPRQEELVTLLDRADLDVARLRNWAIDLSPPAKGSTPID